MQESLNRLENLLQGSIQILDHMKQGEGQDAEVDETVLQMQQVLQEEYRRVSDFTALDGDLDEGRQAISMMQKKLDEVGGMLEPMKEQWTARYHETTDGSPEQYEEQSLEKQKQQELSYHEKIDSKSAIKLQENLEAMNMELLELSGSIMRVTHTNPTIH